MITDELYDITEYSLDQLREEVIRMIGVLDLQTWEGTTCLLAAFYQTPDGRVVSAALLNAISDLDHEMVMALERITRLRTALDEVYFALFGGCPEESC
jgi:hypothetical protein